MVPRWQHPFLKPVPLSLPAVLQALAASPVADRVAVADAGSHLTFRDLDRLSCTLAVQLLAQGVQPGDTVALTERPSVALCVAYLAVGRLGAAVLQLHALLREEDIAHVAALVRPRAWLGPRRQGLPSLPQLQTDADACHHASSATTRALPGLPAPEQVLQYRLTSGTTGQPKVIPLTHRQLLRRTAEPGVWYVPGRRHGCSQMHVFPGYQCLTALATGGTVVFQPLHAAAPLEDFIRDWRIELLWGMPALYALVARQSPPLPAPFPCLLAATSSGAALDPACAMAVSRRWGVPLWQGYGQSELGYLTEAGPGTPHESVGQAVPGVQLRVVDDAGRALPAETRGHIQAQLEFPFSRYLGGEPSPVGSDDWIATGDLGWLGRAGELYVSGRKNEQIQVAGNKVFAADVAAVIRACPGVADAAVFAVSHRLWGEVVAAAVVPVPGTPPLTRQALHRFCRTRLQAWKCPRRVLLLPELPRNALGKVDFPRLQKRAGKGTE